MALASHQGHRSDPAAEPSRRSNDLERPHVDADKYETYLTRLVEQLHEGTWLV